MLRSIPFGQRDRPSRCTEWGVLVIHRRTIRETVENGINDLAELQASLLTAIQLEFATIPPYLCAHWSIKREPGSDPSGVGSILAGVTGQEMLHFGLACNMYTATGGSLKSEIATSDFIPVYPSNGLPGGVHPGLVVSLVPLGSQALQTFMSIEYPGTRPVVLPPNVPPSPEQPKPPTIGQFYEAIARGFNAVFPGGSLPYNPSPSQVLANVGVGSDNVFAINTVPDALNAIHEITVQGEGTIASPDEGTFDLDNLAHYYRFAEIYYGKAVAQTGSGGFEYSGSAITMPAVYNFSVQSADAPDQQVFASAFTTLMNDLEACWTSGFSIKTAITHMRALEAAGRNLLEAGFTPQFTLA
jgi:hypothetical protein